MIYFRNLYEGNHAEIFPRAQTLVKTERHLTFKPSGTRRKRYVPRTTTTANQYVVVNFASLVAEVPADLINRAIGNISADTEDKTVELDFITAVVDASKPSEKIWAAVTQHQVDGMIAYRIRRDDKTKKVWFEWFLGDRYFPHDDDMGADIAWIEDRGDANKKDSYLRVERQRLEDGHLLVTQQVFKIDNDTVGDEVAIADYATKFSIEVPEDVDLDDVDELMCGFVTNDETLMSPRGRSSLRNIDTIQEEINWTITRDSIVFEKHGKPKLAIPAGLWNTVSQENQRHYGGKFVRNADLEVVSYDEKTGAVPMYIVWDAKTEQSFEHVTRLITFMLAVSKTSAQAAGLEEGKGDSGIALLYLWIQSVIKAESIQSKFDAAIKDAIRKCIILENSVGGTAMEPINPVIEWGDMLPKAESEKNTEEGEKYTAGTQSLETTVRRMHPDWSEEAITEEIKKIQDEKALDTLSPLLTQPPRVNLGDAT